jgi:hypothetical protein
MGAEMRDESQLLLRDLRTATCARARASLLTQTGDASRMSAPRVVVAAVSPVGVMPGRAHNGFNCAVTPVIDHLCASEEHQVPEDAPRPVMAYEGGWGYCPAGAVAGHDWRATGGRTLATVREWMGRPVVIATLRQSETLHGISAETP